VTYTWSDLGRCFSPLSHAESIGRTKLNFSAASFSHSVFPCYWNKRNAMRIGVGRQIFVKNTTSLARVFMRIVTLVDFLSVNLDSSLFWLMLEPLLISSDVEFLWEDWCHVTCTLALSNFFSPTLKCLLKK
jgi:hypothetical protein